MSYAPGVAHMLGDYVVQSDWMANEKTSRHLPAALHAATYAACFLPLTRNAKALAVIGGTHFIIDRWRLARHVVWAKNQAAPARWRHDWDDHVKGTGYHALMPMEPGQDWTRCRTQEKQPWMAVWLMIAADNAMHLAINGWSLRRWAATVTDTEAAV